MQFPDLCVLHIHSKREHYALLINFYVVKKEREKKSFTKKRWDKSERKREGEKAFLNYTFASNVFNPFFFISISFIFHRMIWCIHRLTILFVSFIARLFSAWNRATRQIQTKRRQNNQQQRKKYSFSFFQYSFIISFSCKVQLPPSPLHKFFIFVYNF